MPYYYSTKTMKARHAGGDYSTARGPFVEGERMIFGKMTIPAGTRAELHSHPNEQFSYIIQGRIRMEVAGKKRTLGPGDIIHVPANTLHSATVIGEEDHVFITVKDSSWGIHGVKAAPGAKGGKKRAAPPRARAKRKAPSRRRTSR